MCNNDTSERLKILTSKKLAPNPLLYKDGSSAAQLRVGCDIIRAVQLPKASSRVVAIDCNDPLILLVLACRLSTVALMDTRVFTMFSISTMAGYHY